MKFPLDIWLDVKTSRKKCVDVWHINFCMNSCTYRVEETCFFYEVPSTSRRDRKW